MPTGQLSGIYFHERMGAHTRPTPQPHPHIPDPSRQGLPHERLRVPPNPQAKRREAEAHTGVSLACSFIGRALRQDPEQGRVRSTGRKPRVQSCWQLQGLRQATRPVCVFPQVPLPSLDVLVTLPRKIYMSAAFSLSAVS